jgi:hypothetical protein
MKVHLDESGRQLMHLRLYTAQIGICKRGAMKVGTYVDYICLRSPPTYVIMATHRQVTNYLKNTTGTSTSSG